MKKESEIVKTLNAGILAGIEANKLKGFERAFELSNAYKNLKLALTSEYMKPILELQNKKLGFKTDSERGYPESTVKECLIEAVLTGVQPVGNQFNIIASNCYITKEGFGYMLDQMDVLNYYEIIPQLPRINGEKTSAAIVMKIEWALIGGVIEKREIDFPIRMNRMMGTDAVIGKAIRKARAWLYNNISGREISDGDASDLTIEIKADKPELNVAFNPEAIKKEDQGLNQAALDFEKEELERQQKAK